MVELMDAGRHILHRGAVGGKQRPHWQLLHLFQALQIVPEGVFRAQLDADVGGDGAQDVVAAEEQLLSCVIQAHMARGVARRLHHPQVVATVVEHVAVGHIGEVHPGVLAVFPAGVDVGVSAKGGLGKAILDEQIVQHPPVEVAGLKVDELAIGLAGVDGAGLPGEFADQAAVVRMQMGDEQVRLPDAQLIKGALERLLTLGTVEAGVDQQIFLTGDDVGVDVPQGVVGQGYRLFVEILCYFCQHGGFLPDLLKCGKRYQRNRPAVGVARRASLR